MSCDNRGFSLIDVIVGVALMLVLFLALFGILRASLDLSTLTKAKSAAVEIASTQMEYLRGLSYDALGTSNGIPAGNIQQMATTTVDGISYSVRTFIEYYDDPADGVGAADTNGITTDYKIGKVTVSYILYGQNKSVSIVSNFAPPGVEAATNGGTLSLHIVGATGANISNASVQIINTATTPTINFVTFSDANGLVTIGGAATSSQYQIQVSRPGYSSAQTYARTTQNANPTPGYLTVVKNQTTSATFAIDRLATLQLSSFGVATTTTFTDTFINTANLASQTNTQVGGGELTLAPNTLSGSAHSISFTPNYIDGWGILSASLATSTGTSMVLHVDDTSGVPLPDSVLPGNSTGFSSFPVSLTGIATSSYPGLTLEADLTSNSTTTTPALLDWSLSHTEGPAPYPNLPFTLTGAKTIGTDSNGTPIYKTIVSDTTGATGAVSESLEWDAYTLTLGSVSLLESCIPSPYVLNPGDATSSSLLIGTPTGNILPVQITNSSGSPIPAKVILTTNTYAATLPTSACGFAYFNGLPPGTYTATVSATGYTTTAFPNLSVSKNTATTTLTLP
ncbi:MAG TPA: carboxypeptidase regulatory-like domain-containing protein [Candidatus Paceibacterota bacterium]|nr:carboxypeptidase regulatory-like domain-containing protein [Candidatus Paceibacterota bacterium]